MKLTGVADTAVAEKMKHIKVKMKLIKVRNLNAEVKMKPTGVADLDTGVKTKPIEVKMKPIGIGSLDVEVKKNETDLLNPDIEVKMNVTFHFDSNDEVKTVDINVGMKPLEQNLVDGFYFEVADEPDLDVKLKIRSIIVASQGGRGRVCHLGQLPINQ